MANRIKALTGNAGRQHRLKRLLDMDYKFSEIVEETGIPLPTLNLLVKAGAPVKRDAGGRRWINGTEFAAWFHETRAEVNRKAAKVRVEKVPYADNESWCMVCKRKVTYTEERVEGRMSYGICENGHNVTRIRKAENDKP